MSRLNMVMAVGRDGYIARSLADDMRWTGQMDKAIFKLLTSVNAIVGMSNRSADLLPPAGLLGRKVVRLSQTGMTLHEFAVLCPSAWLGVGPTLATQALAQNYVGAVFICHLDRECCGPDGKKTFPQAIEDPTQQFLQKPKWSLESTIHFGSVVVAVHRRV